MTDHERERTHSDRVVPTSTPLFPQEGASLGRRGLRWESPLPTHLLARAQVAPTRTSCQTAASRLLISNDFSPCLCEFFGKNPCVIRNRPLGQWKRSSP